MVTHSCGILKIAVRGGQGVGKSAVIRSYVHDCFDPFLQSGIGIDFLSKNIQLEDDKILVQFWETELELSNALIIIYDVTSRDSFNFAQKLLTEKTTDSIPILLLANKSDMESKRQISRAEGEITALRYSVMFQEVSCLRASELKDKILDFVATIAVV